MNQNVAIGIVVVLALLAGGYLWYQNQGALPLVEEAREAPSETPPSSTAITQGIEGSWRSSADPKFTRSFGAGGTVTDRYEGQADVTGHYELDGDHVPAQVKSLAGSAPVLAIEYPEEAQFFLVTKLTATELELLRVGTTETLRFTRM
ncbi:MAG TPA: hypothetical protein VEA36_03370 [Candidatus Paceibacterota bacterium]|nr:hypothetical protein [Candidatus Paceibacterota bacterium]